MTRTKKVLGLLLALAMVFGCMTMAFATDPGAAARAATLTVTSTATELAAGETATITVSATTNFTASTASIPVFYNKTLVSVSNVTAAADTIGTAVIATDADATDSTLVYANTGYSADEYGFVLVQFTAADGETVADTLSNKALITFTVTAKADVEGDATVVVPATALKTTSNFNGKLYFGCSTEGTTVAGVPELVSNIDTTAATKTITIGSAEPNTLLIKDDFADSGIVIDKIFVGLMSSDDWFPEFAEAEDVDATGLVYGFDTLCYMGNDEELALADILTTTYGDEYLVITTADASDGWETTGTKIEVLDKDGSTVLETYYFVYFGDINGDGAVDSTDVTWAVRYNRNGSNIETLAQLAAADMNGDAFAESSDVTLVVRANRYEEYVEQDIAAADFYACVEEYAAE